MIDCDVWLYERCAAPWLGEDDFPASYRQQRQEWEQAIQTLSRRERLLCVDVVDNTRLLWGAKSFVWGLRLGMLLAQGTPGEDDWAEGLTAHAVR